MSVIVLDMYMEDFKGGMFMYNISQMPPGVKLVLMGDIEPDGWGGDWCQVGLHESLPTDLVMVYDHEHPGGRASCRDCLGPLPETRDVLEWDMADRSIEDDIAVMEDLEQQDLARPRDPTGVDCAEAYEGVEP